MKAKQLATGMLVAVLLLSGFIVFPSATVEAASGSAPISLNVVDSTNTPVGGATVTITETHTSKTYSTTSDQTAPVPSGLATFSPLPGYYILRISKSGYFDLEYPTVLKYDGMNAYNIGLVQIASQSSTTGTISVTVNGGLAVILKTIDLNSPTEMTTTHNFTGSTVLTVPASTYRLVTSATGYETDVRDVTVGGGNVNVNIVLGSAAKVSGFALRSGVPAQDMTAYLISTNTGLSLEKRIIEGRVSGNYYEFDAFAGTFYLLVDGKDVKASMQSITITGSQSQPIINLVPQSPQVDSLGVKFASDDWNSFDLYRNMTMDYDAAWPNMAYSYIPNIRMQIDFAFGDGNNVVSQAEFDAFLNMVKAYGPVNVTSDYLVTVNSTKYTVLTDFTYANFTGLANRSVASLASYTASFVTPFTSQESLVNGGSRYNVIAYGKYDTSSLDNKVYLTWPSGNEMTSNSTSTDNVTVTGYMTVTIDPVVRTVGTMEKVTMTIQESLAPTARGGVDVPSDYGYEVANGTSVLYYIVHSEKAIIFTGNGSSDPNGNPMRYSWTFGDGGSQSMVGSPWTKYTYGAKSFNLTVTLTVTDMGGLTDVDTFYVKSDGIDPTPSFFVKDHTIGTQTPNLIVDQNEALVFNGGDSYDHINSTDSSDVGIIREWLYIWGDGNSTSVGVGEGQDVTKTYADAGTFTMMLNTTDAAGRVSTKSIIVHVKDKAAPVVAMKVYLAGAEITTAKENQTLVFSGNSTRDANDSFGDLTFAWTFDDGESATGAWTRHNYTNIGTFTVTLEVTDKSGNKGNATKELSITSQPRPDLRIVKVVASPSTMTEGETGVFKVNVTNVGSVNASTPRVTVYRLNPDSTRTELASSSSMKVNGVSSSILQPNQYGEMEVSWVPSGKGNYTYVIEVSALNEVARDDNTYTSAITVNEASWKAIALYGGIFAVIIAAIVLYYYRKRLPKLGGRKDKASYKEESKKFEERERKGKK